MNRTLGQELKYQYQSGGMHIKLIAVNVLIFLVISLISVFTRLGGHELDGLKFLVEVFTLSTDPSVFAIKPWGFVTSIFSHFTFIHLLGNMFFLFFAGRIFLMYFSNRMLLHVYILGGLFGGILEIIARLVFPGLAGANIVVLGASGAVMAVLAAAAFYRPMLKLSFFGFFSFPIILVVALYILQDFTKLGANDFVAHFAHLGGGILGWLAITNKHSKTNVIALSYRISNWFSNLFTSFGKPRKAKMTVQRGGGRVKTDEEYLAEAKEKQDRVNKILDKISKSGYESLSKAEKDFLFSQSKK